MERRGPDRRVVAAGLACLAAAGPVGAQDPAEPSTDETVDLAPDASRRLTAEVLIDGRGPFTFVVDTGANRTALARDLAENLGLAVGPQVRVHSIAGAYLAETARIDRLQVGLVEARDLYAPLLSRQGVGADGLLGVDVFRNRRAVLDLRHNRLILETSRSSALRGFRTMARGGSAVDIPVRARQRSGQLMIFDAEVLGSQVVCFVDTGASVSVGNGPLLRLLNRRRGPPRFPPNPVTLRSATGQSLRAEMVDMPGMRVGGVRLTAFDLPFADMHTFAQWGLADRPAMLFGVDVLKVFDAVTLDFARGEIVFRLREKEKSR